MKLILAVLILLVLFFVGCWFLAALIKGIEILPQYIGGFGTFMLYVAGFMLLFAGILKIKKD